MNFFSILFLVFSTKAFANCELATWRFHTEAVYEFPKSITIEPFQSMSRDGGILFISEIDEKLKKDGFFQKKKDRFGTYNGLSLEGATVRNYESTRGNVTFLRLKEDLVGIPPEPITFINWSERSIVSTEGKYTPLAVQKMALDTLPSELKSALKTTISKKGFSIVEDLKDYSHGVPVEYNQQSLGENVPWTLTQVLVNFKLKSEVEHVDRGYDPVKKKKVKSINAWVSFLSNNSKFWYIGNSSGAPCGNDILNESVKVDDDGTALVGYQLDANYGLKFKGKEDELIYSFGDSNIVYFLKFNEAMVVMVDEKYR